MPGQPEFEAPSVRDLPLSYVCYDLETSGLGPGSHVMEMGAVRVEEGREVASFSSFVALPPGARVEPEAAAVNHISEAMLTGAPSAEEAHAAFARFVGELPLVGQNIVAVDNRYLDDLAVGLGVRSVTENGCLDTMLLYRELVGKPANLAAICAFYGVENETPHRALADARATSECYLALVADARSRVALVGEPDGEPVGHELDGELLCFTGNCYEYPKRLCELLALAHGARVRQRVSGRVTLVVSLEGRESGKVRWAREHGVPVVSGNEFLARIGLSSGDLRC